MSTRETRKGGRGEATPNQKGDKMKREVIKSEDGIDWIKFTLLPRQRLERIGMLLPDLLLPRFWDGEKDTYGPLTERLDSFVDDLRAGLLGYWVGCQPSNESHPLESTVRNEG